jgi:hypothetical protein
MEDSWWNHNTDKMLLLFLVVLFWFTTLGMAYLIFRYYSDNMIAVAFVSFLTGSVSTVLGALVMMLTGRANRADGQTGNGVPPVLNPPQPTGAQ